MAARAAGLYSSAFAIAELACVFSRQIRERRMTAAQAAIWRRRFREDLREGVWVLFPVSEHLLDRAEAMIGGLPPEVYLRAGDAIHLTTAHEHGFDEIWSNDRRLLSAATHFGMKGRSVQPARV